VVVALIMELGALAELVVVAQEKLVQVVLLVA
jgi:hypothetical protein